MYYFTMAHQKCVGSYSTMSGSFKEYKNKTTEILQNERILVLMFQIMDKLATHLGIDQADTIRASTPILSLAIGLSIVLQRSNRQGVHNHRKGHRLNFSGLPESSFNPNSDE
jgi:hypothetical protein